MNPSLGLTANDKEKADVLGRQMSKVFVNEPDGELPNCVNRGAPVLHTVGVTRAKVRKLLKKLKISKSPGPDGIHPRIIKEAMEELVEPLVIVSINSTRIYFLVNNFLVCQRSSFPVLGSLVSGCCLLLTSSL